MAQRDQPRESTERRRVLIAGWPFAGHISPLLAIAAELQTLEFEVAFLTGRASLAAVERAGFRAIAFQAVDEELVTNIVLSPDGVLSAQGNPVRLLSLYRRWLLDTVPDQLVDLQRAIDEMGPHSIVTDATFWAPFLILAERFSLPVAVFSLIPACHLSGRDAPVLGFSRPRPKSAGARLARDIFRFVAGLSVRGTRVAANRMRRAYGLPPISCSVTDFAATMPLYLVPSSPEFDYQRTDLPASVRYVGPCVAAPAAEPVAGLEALDPAKPWIYVSEGTIHLDPVLLRSAAQGLSGLDAEVILTVGKHRDPATLPLGPRPLAPNIHVREWVDLNALLPRLAAVVNVGGPGTLMAAVNAGLPVVIVPFAWDHPETGFRIRESGAGVMVEGAKCSPRTIREAVEKVLSDPSYRQNAARLAEGFRKLGGAKGAAIAIAEMTFEKSSTGERKRALGTVS
jgi:MGT family glycosyltransferase